MFDEAAAGCSYGVRRPRVALMPSLTETERETAHGWASILEGSGLDLSCRRATGYPRTASVSARGDDARTGKRPEPSTVNDSITKLLEAARAGDAQATDELFTAVYGELKVLARSHRRRWHGNETMNTTALIHEAFLKLSGGDQQGFV